MRTIVAFVLASGASVASAGALQECLEKVADAGRVVTCLRQARSAATEEMLEHFLGVEQAISALGGHESSHASAALKQSQRAFERYVLEHCHGVQPLIAGGEAANLACETDLLRQRASALEALENATNRI